MELMRILIVTNCFCLGIIIGLVIFRLSFWMGDGGGVLGMCKKNRRFIGCYLIENLITQ